MDRQAIQAILDSDYAQPDAPPLRELTSEFEALLGSTDPFLRENALEILWQWIQQGLYSDEALVELGDRMTANLAVGEGESGTDTVFLRAFSALVLAGILMAEQQAQYGHYRDRAPFLTEEKTLHWFDAAITCFAREQDRRGYVEDKGWAHAFAHEADLLSDFAASRHLGTDSLHRLLDTIADKMIEPCESILQYNEDNRIVQAVLDVLRRDLVSSDGLVRWLGKLSQTADGGHWGEVNGMDGSVRPMNIARMNTRAFLRSLYFQLEIGSRSFRSRYLPERFACEIKGRDELKAAVLNALRAMEKYFYPAADAS